jgi:hypothetical protein
MQYYCDNYRHLICLPYSKENLHLMAESLIFTELITIYLKEE